MSQESNFRRVESARSLKKGDDTRLHILSVAKTCFNSQGVSQVTCRTIAETAGLSAGNVYYYFSNKDVILDELRSSLIAEANALLDEIAEERYVTAESREDGARRWMDMVWEWRFIYLDIHHLIRDNTRARQELLDLQHKSIALHQQLFEEHLVKRGLTLTPEDKKFCHDLAVTNWLTLVHWLQHMCMEKGELEITKDDFVNSLPQSQMIGRMFYDDNIIKRLAEKAR